MKKTAKGVDAAGAVKEAGAVVEVEAADTAVIAKAGSDPRLTPAMRQYHRFKQSHPECILFFRMGDFYEMFDTDALTAHKVLGITLTQRTEGVPMAGVPYHAVEGYLRRMIAAGYRVAVCDQIQDPKEAKGIVDRAVTRVLTPGTLVDEALLDESASNHVAAVMFTEAGEHSAAVAAVAEISTGTFTLHELAADRVADELARIGVAELLYVQTADGATPARVKALADVLGCVVTARPGWTFRISDAAEYLRQHFNVVTLDGFGIGAEELVVCVGGALLRYLQETQTPGETADGTAAQRGAMLGHLQPPVKRAASEYVVIDASTLRSLELDRTLRSGQTAGSLFAIVNRCRTPMGRRLLRQWLCFPLRDIKAIEARQDIVATLVNDREFAERLHNHIGGVQDVARIAGRIALLRATPRDLVALGASTAKVQALLSELDGWATLAAHRSRLMEIADTIGPLSAKITAMCVEAPPPHLREGGVFRDGVDAELDETRLLQSDANSWLAAYQKQLIDQTQINSLKVGYNKVFGYYIEITHAHATKIPAIFSRKQTLKNAERYITPELKEFEEKVTTAEARGIEREKAMFESLCREAAMHTAALTAFAELVAELDVLLSFAELSVRQAYCRPVLVDEPVLAIREGRHAVLDQTLGNRFVPNDTVLGVDAEASVDDAESLRRGPALALITGPNMAGKSTFIRQTALIVLLAHAGCFVPATRAVIGVADRIFTRIGANDELHAGQSTFMVEMTETANILHHATERSLVILDEIGRGTSTLDGLSLAWAIAESLAERGCRTLFATHYHELTTLAEAMPQRVRNLHVSVREWADQIIFVYRILPGSTDRSYGLHVATLAGLPRETVQRAGELLETLSVQTGVSASASGAAPDGEKKHPRRKADKGEQLALFKEYVEHPVVADLRKLDIDALSPIAAFDALRRLRESVNSVRE